MKMASGANYRELCPSPVTPFTKKVEIKYPSISEGLVMDALIISRPLSTMFITVGTTPTLILQPPHPTPYLVLNPSLSVGLTISKVWTLAAVTASGNVQASSLGVANYAECHFHLDVTGLTGTATWSLIAQSKDPGSANWANVQNIFPTLDPAVLAAPYTKYDRIGQHGLCTDLAFSYTKTGGGAGDALTATITATLKNGLGGSSSGLANTIFLGGRNVVAGSGFALFEGKEKVIYPGPDVEVYAVAYANTIIKVFTL